MPETKSILVGEHVLHGDVMIGTMEPTGQRGCWMIEMLNEFGGDSEVIWMKKDALQRMTELYHKYLKQKYPIPGSRF